MKKRLIHRSKPSAFNNALLSIAIVANSPSTQQAIALLALALFTLREVAA